MAKAGLKWWPLRQAHTLVTSIMLEPLWRDKADHVYVGMPCTYTRKRGIEAGPYGKPWACLNDERGWDVAYREYLIKRVTSDESFIRDVLALHGKTLVCFCKGGRRGTLARCHADWLALVAERLYHGIRERDGSLV